MTNEIPQEVRAKKYVKLKSIGITEEQSQWLYENKVSPQALLAHTIDKLMNNE